MTLEDQEDHYQAYVLRVEYERDLRANEILQRKLTRALALMPNLVNVYVHHLLQTQSMKKEKKLRVSQETLCEPCYFAETRSGTSRQRCEILEILCNSNSKIKRLEGRLVRCETMEHPSVPLHGLGRHIRHFALNFLGHKHCPIDSLVRLRKILEKAFELETLQLSFCLVADSTPIIHLDQIWPNAVHYSSLKALSLCSLRMSQLRLLGFLSLHALTLRSLYLGDIHFEWKEARDHICAGSWTDTIHFLEEHLNLTRVEFEGALANGWNEAWHLKAREDQSVYNCDYKPPTETLKYRIEQYIVEGGICPLDLPRGREFEDKMDYWLKIGDSSCRWYPKGCNPSVYDDRW